MLMLFFYAERTNEYLVDFLFHIKGILTTSQKVNADIYPNLKENKKFRFNKK